MRASLLDRHREAEIMDQPELDVHVHRRALDGLARLNWISSSAWILWGPIAALCRQRHHEGNMQPVRVLDLATGGGDVPIRLQRRAQREHLNLEIVGCDISVQAIAYAEQRAQRQRAAVRFFRLDVFKDAIPLGFDIITSSLFLHHLEEDDAVKFLRKMKEAAGHSALVNDLVRSRLSWWLVLLGSRLLSRSYVVHGDGLASIHAAFTIPEALALAQQAGWDNASIHRHWRWLCRYLLQWSRLCS